MNNGRVCVSVCASTAGEMIENVKRAGEYADVVELRFDCLRSEDVPLVLENVTSSRALLATFRPAEQGGRHEIALDERKGFWSRVKPAFWADVEEDTIGSAAESGTRIVSHHDFSGSIDDLDAVYERLSALDADVIKIAVQTNDAVDAIPVWNLLERANSENKQLIPIAMGDAGKWTRILGLAHGAFMTYAALETGSETAPGQITAREMAEIFRVRELSKRTQVFGVIGDPISQSLSPHMHNPAFVAMGIDAVFLSLLVKDLSAFMRRMVRAATREVELNFGGFSVTMPHKQAIIPMLDAIDPTAAKIGAVNTVKIMGGKMTGYNTDAHGFLTPLRARYSELRNARVVVLGAGGAALAVTYALKEEGADVTVCARDEQKAAAFASEFGARAASISSIRDRRTKISADFDIVVDTTPLGMKGPLENESLLMAEQLEGLKLVYDLVTKATDTPILSEAKLAGVDAIGGLEMLFAQGAKQTEIWTGQAPPAELMRASILSRISEVQR